VFLALAGILLLAMGCWQSVRRPLRVTEQVPPGFPAVNGPALVAEAAALGFGDALALGLGFGAALAGESPVSMRALAAVMTIRAGQRLMPGRCFHFNCFHFNV
jgi:hypothetical protein